MEYSKWMKEIDKVLSEISQMFMFGYREERKDEFFEFLKIENPGFVILFKRNFKNKSYIKKLTKKIHSLPNIYPLIFVDQEGGTVVQFGEELSTSTSAMGTAATGNPEYAKLSSEIISEDLNKAGFDGVLAPVVDVNYESKNPIIGLRAFSDSEKDVVKYAKSFLEGLKTNSILGVLKHFPGHGGAKEDSHASLPKIYSTPEYLKATSLLPYFRLKNKVHFVMTAHTIYPYIDRLPSTLSAFFNTEILRNEIGFKGILISDCLEMKAIKENFSLEDTVKLAVQSGIDVLLFSHTLEIQKKAISILKELVKRKIVSLERIKKSIERIKKVKNEYLESRVHIKGFFREHYSKELLISQKSITALRWREEKKPLRKKLKIGIIEFEKLPSTIPIDEALKTSYLFKHFKKSFNKLELLLLPLKETNSSLLKNFMQDKDEIIVGVYSRGEYSKKVQGKIVKKIIRINPKSVVVSLGNPYDIEEFPDVNFHLLTYGFRKVQIEALISILKGKEKPEGKLPVDIKNFFKKGHGIKKLF